MTISSDNYYLIRRRGERWYVTGESASNTLPSELDIDRARSFLYHADAVAYAHGQYSEYGVRDFTNPERLEDFARDVWVQAWQDVEIIINNDGNRVRDGSMTWEELVERLERTALLHTCPELYEEWYG